MSHDTHSTPCHRCSPAAAATLVAGPALAYNSHDFTTTASTAGTTAYIVGKNHHDDFAAAHEFAHSQRVALRREAASGGGENVNALADLLGAADGQTFGEWMQRHYAALYPAIRRRRIWSIASSRCSAASRDRRLYGHRLFFAP